MFIRRRIAFFSLALALLPAPVAFAQRLTPLEFKHTPDRELPPFTDIANLRLTLDANYSYVLGTDPILLHVSLTNRDANHGRELLWRANAPQRVLTGFTYSITAPDGQTHIAKTCREGSDIWNTTEGVNPDKPFGESIDLTAPNCFDFKLTQPGHYAVEVDFKRPVCSPPQPNGCRIDEEHGEFSLLTIKSNRIEFDVLPPYTGGNPGPSEATPPSTADPQIKTWLSSGNPRIVAWASYFILRDHPAGGVTDLQSWLASMLADNRVPLTVWNMNVLERERSNAAHVVFDALIQAHAELSAAQIQTIAADDPVPALIFAMLPKWNETAVLNVFDLVGGIKSDIHRGNTDPGYEAIVNTRYLAGEALAASGSRAFLDKLKAEFILNLEFRVIPAKDKNGIGSGRGCFGGLILRRDPVPGWPPTGNYGLSAGVPKQLFNETTGHYVRFDPTNSVPPSQGDLSYAFDPTNSVPLGQGNLRYTRIVSQNYGAAAFSYDGCREDLRWIELYGRRGERLGTNAVFYTSDDEDYHDQLRKWVASIGAVYAQILSDAGAPLAPLKIRMHGIDFMQPAPGSNVSEANTFNFTDFPPPGVTIASQ